MNRERYKEFMAAVDAVLDAAADDRQKVLSEVCGGDLALRREVERLLRQNTAAEGFLEDLPEPIFHEPSLDGTILGKYRLIRKLGAGGMGTVHLAERCDGVFEQTVAIKLIKRGMDSAAMLKRFVNERQILATFEHPNIARLIDGGTTDDGLPYFVMEYVDGAAIDKFVVENSQAIEERLGLFAQICYTVDYAHTRNVIHRDIKPSNILVSASGQPKLLDFGIAKLVEGETGATETETAWRLLTPEYASPEQVMGGKITNRTDVYSLGVLLFELLTGRGPYEFTSRSPLEIAQTICEQDPELPSQVASRNNLDANGFNAQRKSGSPDPVYLRRRLRGDLDRIVMTALQKDPDRRYDSAAELAADVRRHLDGRRVHASGLKWKDRVSRTFKRIIVRRWKPAFTVYTILFVVAVSFASAFWFVQRSAPRPQVIKSMAILPFSYEGDGDPYIGPGIADALISKLGRTRQFDVRPLRAVMTYASAEARDLKLISQTLQVDAVLDGTVRKNGDNMEVRATFFDPRSDSVIWSQAFTKSSENVAGLQEDIFQDVIRRLSISGTSIKTKGTHSAAAYDAFLKGRFQWNRRQPDGHEKAISFFEQAIALDPEYAEAYAGLGDAYAQLTSSVPGETHKERPQRMKLARQSAEKAIALDSSLAQPYATLGYIGWHYEWDWAASDQAFRKSIELDPSYPTAHHWYSFLLARVNRMDEAVAEIKRARELDPLSVIIANDVGEILYWAGRYEEAIEAARTTTELAGDGSQRYYVPSAYRFMGDNDGWLAALQISVEESNRGAAELEALAEAYFRLGELNLSRQALAESRRRSGSRESKDPVKYFAREEELKRFVVYLKDEYGFRGAGITMAHNHPNFSARLRSDPRVQQYIRLAGLSEYALPATE